MIALLLAFNCRSFGILNTTLGNDKNKLCDISNRSKSVRSASSSGNLLIWLFDKFKSAIKSNAIQSIFHVNGLFLMDDYLWSNWISWRISVESSWWRSSSSRMSSIQYSASNGKQHPALVLIGIQRDLKIIRKSIIKLFSKRLYRVMGFAIYIIQNEKLMRWINAVNENSCSAKQISKKAITPHVKVKCEPQLSQWLARLCNRTMCATITAHNLLCWRVFRSYNHLNSKLDHAISHICYGCSCMCDSAVMHSFLSTYNRQSFSSPKRM